MVKLNTEYVKDIARTALNEDVGSGDITTRNLIPPTQKIVAVIVACESGIVAGLPIVKQVFKTFDKKCIWRSRLSDGKKIKKGQTVAVINGFARSILICERTALNFLSHLSGIATLTGRFVSKVKKSNVEIYDTRKTLPGLRLIEKYAVNCGGGFNNRMQLDDMVIIKDNHVKVCTELGLPIGQLVRTLYTKVTRGTEIEFETQNLREVMLALQCDVDMIMLDNMSYEAMKKAIKLIRKSKKNIKIEVSGKMNLKNIERISRLDVDRISIGAITHSAPAMDFSLEICS